MSVLAAGAAGAVGDQLVQIAGALLVLAAFAAAQVGALSTRSSAYLLLNLVGATVLAALAAEDGQLGFLLLEGMWALVSAASLVRKLRRPRATTLGGPRREEIVFGEMTTGAPKKLENVTATAKQLGMWFGRARSSSRASSATTTASRTRAANSRPRLTTPML